MSILFRVTTVPVSLQKLITGQLPYMKSHNLEPIMVSADGPEVEEVIKEQECPHFAITLTRTISPVKDLFGLWQFYKLCRRYRPTIIHSHTPKAGVIAMLGGKLAGVPIRLHTVAGMPLMETVGVQRRILEWVEKLTYSFATKVYPNSTNLKAFILEKKFCKAEKLKVVGNGSSNGIDTNYFSLAQMEESKLQKLREQLQIKEGDFVYVFVGRLVKDKGIQELVESFIQLRQKFPFIKLLLVGWLEQELDPLSTKTLQQMDEEPGILFVGFQKDVRPYLAISHALVFPSYREGFPNVPMQAGCFDLPSIVTDINGCNEIIEDGVNGLIIPPKSAPELQKAMEKLLVDREVYAHLRQNARRLIVERYEQRHVWELLLQEYQEQMNQPCYV